MRWSPRILAVSGALLATLTVPGVVASAAELPPGFTDGQPVGQQEGAAPGSAQASGVGAAAATERYFGEQAYAAVRAAVTGTTRSCSITDDGLTALVLAPVFKESSAATTAATAPAPMTLSRYDEWNGVRSTTQGTPENNYGLYAFRDPGTAYRRAFWHPGIGIWQYDTAGLGAPLTTVEAMDAGVVAGDVAALMARKYCSPSSALIGHGPPYSAQERRYAAWSDWGFKCTLCQGFFDEMYLTSPRFANLNLVPGISALGGVVRHACTLPDTSGTVPCWYVDPRPGVIQGATAWATLSPLDGGDPTVVPTPLSYPFYVVDRGTTEERHWMKVDTGYPIDIRASRTIGKDARPRSTQPGSGLTWSGSSGLCDVTTARGVCTPVPPAGVRSAPVSASSGFRPVALDADGDGRGDVLWYRPGAGKDYLWLGRAGGVFESRAINVGGTYDDVLTGDVDGDHADDVLWYARSTGEAYLWRSSGAGTFTSVALSPGAGRQPLLLDTNADGHHEVFWYGPGSLPDAQWSWVGSGFTKSARSVLGTYRPFVGDFDGNNTDDIFWYAPGSTADSVWLHSTRGAIVTKPMSVYGSYTPVVGDFDGDLVDDIVWYAPGPATDTGWFGGAGAAFAPVSLSVLGHYLPIVADLTGSGSDTLIWYAPGATSDYQWSWTSDRVLASASLLLPGTHRPVVGGFSAGGADGVLWYEPNLATDVIWFR